MQIPHCLIWQMWTDLYCVASCIYRKQSRCKFYKCISGPSCWMYLKATSLRTVYRIFLSKFLSFRFSRNLTKEANLCGMLNRWGVPGRPCSIELISYTVMQTMLLWYWLELKGSLKFKQFLVYTTIGTGLITRAKEASGTNNGIKSYQYSIVLMRCS